MRNKRCMAIAFAFIFAFMALAVPRIAFAYEYNAYTIFQNEWYEDGDIDPTQGWIIYANNKYDAALYVCGDNVSNLTDEQLSYLSDPNYGGAFYSLAQKFGSGFEHEWIPDYVRPMLALVDFDKVQVGTATTYEIRQAKERLQEIMNGDYGSGGGSGGGSGVTGETVTFTGTWKYVWGSTGNFLIDANGNKYSQYTTSSNSPTWSVFGNPFTVNIPTSYIAGLIQQAGDTSYCITVNPINQGNVSVTVYAGDITSTTGVTGTQPSNYSQYQGLTYISRFQGSNCKYTSFSMSKNDYTFDGSTLTFTKSYTNNSSYNVNVDTSADTKLLATMGGNVTPPAPDGDWPSEPVAPSPPEVPTPTSPTVPVEPEPTIPQPTTPSDPIYIPVQAPDSTDYTDWLRAILEALNAIDDDLVTFASNVGDYFSAQNTFLRQIISDMATHCDHLQVRMREEFAALTDYLNDLFTWLAGQMEFNFEGYDDSSIIGWLRKIYARMGGGTYKPNPDAEPKNFLDWLLEQWSRFFTSLLEKLPDAMGDLVNDFQQLTRFFPFSIPWDLAALLGLFAHAPVTPVFDIPLPYGAGAGQTASIHVDCTPWDGVAAMVRPCLLAMFCLQLALLTRDLLQGLNVTGGDE